jgi:hypothetical protein
MLLALVLIVVGLLVLVAVIASLYPGTVTGALVIDTGWGRRLQPLGPISVDIAADRKSVYGLLIQPYFGGATHALADKVQVVERGSNVVLAAHRTPSAAGWSLSRWKRYGSHRPNASTFDYYAARSRMSWRRLL